MDAIPFKKPSAKALLQSLPDADRKAFVTQMIEAAVAMEIDKDAIGYVAMVLFRDGKRQLWWNTVRGSARPLENGLRRSNQEIVKHMLENEG